MSDRDKSHGRVENARQKLVNAEEAYLRAWGWEHRLYAGTWLWCRALLGAPPEMIAMTRAEACNFQRHNIEG